MHVRQREPSVIMLNAILRYPPRIPSHLLNDKAIQKHFQTPFLAHAVQGESGKSAYIECYNAVVRFWLSVLS